MKPSSDPSPLVAAFWKTCGLVVTLGFGFWGVVLLKGAVQTSYNKRNPGATPIQTEVNKPEAPPAPPPAQPASEQPPIAPTAIAAVDTSAGQKVYNTVCIACHQPTGQGLPGMFPPLAGSDWVSAPKPDRLIRIVLHGLMGPININGAPFNTPAPMMPPQGAALNDEQIAQVITHVRTTWGGQSKAVATEEVTAIRTAEKARTAMWTAAELVKIADH